MAGAVRQGEVAELGDDVTLHIWIDVCNVDAVVVAVAVDGEGSEIGKRRRGVIDGPLRVQRAMEFYGGGGSAHHLHPVEPADPTPSPGDGSGVFLLGLPGFGDTQRIVQEIHAVI